jgi:heptosyltransferase I
MQILIVKTSSMGDVVHALPALSDMLAARPQLQVDWLVETPFADIVRLHPGVRRVWPLAWRKWRKKLLDAEVRKAIGTLRRDLRSVHYDLVLDLQGLLKSALWGRQAKAPMVGYDKASAREPLAAMFYARRAGVSRELQAVERNRRLAAAHLGYAMPDSPADFGLRAPAGTWHVQGRAAALVPCASRVEKLWPEDRWIAVGKHLRTNGLQPIIVWGNEVEHARAQRIAAGCEGEVPPFLSVADMAAVLARVEQVVGLDTGFTHIAAAFGRPTVGIYCDHEPGLAGITGSGPVKSLGGKGQVPSLEEVMRALSTQLATQP